MRLRREESIFYYQNNIVSVLKTRSYTAKKERIEFRSTTVPHPETGGRTKCFLFEAILSFATK